MKQFQSGTTSAAGLPVFTPCFFYSTSQSPQYFSQINLIYLQCTTQSYSKLPKPKTTEMCILESGSKSICPNRPFGTEKTKIRRPRQCEASGYIWEGTIYGYFTLCIVSKCVFPTLPFPISGLFFPWFCPPPV